MSVGSPPQVRGKPAYLTPQTWCPGITPAGAGKTLIPVYYYAKEEDHPRRCGENVLAVAVAACKRRITPAGAGKTSLKPSNSPQRWDHPRRCGENLSQSNSGIGESGSPPQVRGKPDKQKPVRLKRRITPAGAGKTSNSSANSTANTDHPRRCGENFATVGKTLKIYGSPPQVRGKPVQEGTWGGNSRITPAGAGKTCRLCL